MLNKIVKQETTERSHDDVCHDEAHKTKEGEQNNKKGNLNDWDDGAMQI